MKVTTVLSNETLLRFARRALLSAICVVWPCMPAKSFELVAEYSLDTLGWDRGFYAAAEFSPDGRTIAFAWMDEVKLLDVLTGKRTAGIPVHRRGGGTVEGIAFSPDGRSLAVATSRYEVSLWSVPDAKLLWRTNLQRQGCCTDIEFGSFGRKIFLGVSGSALDVRTGAYETAPSDLVLSVSNGVPLPSGHARIGMHIDNQNRSKDGLIFLDAFNRSHKFSIPNLLSMALSTNARHLVSTQSIQVSTPSADEDVVDVVFWELDLTQLTLTRKGSYRQKANGYRTIPHPLSVSPDGKRTFVKRFDGAFLVLQAGKAEPVFETTLGYVPHRTSIIISNDGTRLALVTYHQPAKLQILLLPANWGTAPVPFVATSADTLKAQQAALEAIRSNDAEKLAKVLSPDVLAAPADPPLLTVAAIEGTGALIDVFVAAGADLDALAPGTEWTALMSAARAENTDTMSALLSKGARADIVGPVGNTFTSLLINSAVPADGSSLVAALKRKLVKQLGSRNLGALLAKAAATGDRHMVSTLIGIGADPNQADTSGYTAMMRVAVSKSETAPDVLRDLMVFGHADPDRKASDGATALSLAIAGKASIEMLQRLVAVSDLEYKNAGGASYWDIAESVGNTMALGLLPRKVWTPPATRFPKLPAIEVVLKRDMSRDEIKAAQRALKSLGLYPGTVDGVWGPASRRGLAAYFKVTLDGYYDGLNRFCSAIGEDLERRRLAGENVSGKASRDGEVWESSFNGDRYETLVREPEGAFVTCNIRVSGSRAEPVRASLWEKGQTVEAMYSINCSSQPDSRRSSVLWNGHIVAADFSCRSLMAGEPISNGTLSWWHKY